MATKTLRVFAEYTSTGFVPMPTAGNIDYGYTLGSTFPATTPTSFQTDNPDLVVTVTAMTDFYVWIRINGTAWNPSYTRNVRVYPDSANINNVVMNMIIATGPAGVSSYTQIVQTSNRLYFNGATTDAIYNSKFAGKTYINELNFGTAPGLATVATTGVYADLTGKPTLATVATSGLFTDLSSKPTGTAPLSYNSGTNSFVITQATTSTNGYLSSTDWNTFNNKFATPTGTTLQYVTGNGTLATFPLLASADKLVIGVRNSTGVSIPKGSVVYINGATGNKPTIALSQANSDATSAQTLGLLQATLANNAEGYVVIVGAITDLNTSAFSEGQQLYLSPTTAGAYTATKQYAPNHLVYIGVVSRSHVSLGTIEVKVQNGYEMDELHDVSAQTPSNNDGLFYETSTGLWKNKSISTILGYTPYNGTDTSIKALFSATTPLSYSNGVYSISQATTSSNGYLSSTDWNTFNGKTSNAGTVTSVTMTVPLGLTVSGSPITTSGTLALTLTAGYVIPSTTSTSQWDIAYTNRITSFTTTGSSGSASLVSNALNIPTYTLSGLGGQPALSGTGFVKISGTTISYDNVNYLPLTGSTMSGSIGFSDSALTKRGMYGVVGSSDNWFIGAGATATNSGFIEIATGDDGIEPIYVRQYSGDPYTTGSIARTATLLDASGNTTFPNTLTATSLVKSGGTSSQFLKADGSVDSNSYQTILTNPLTGTGTTNTIPKFTSSSAIGNSNITDNGTTITLNSNSYVNGNLRAGVATDAGYRLDVTGLSRITGTTASDSPPLGSELLTTSNWTSTNWTGDYTNGFSHTTGNTSVLSNTLAAVIGTYYKVQFTVTNRTAGSFTVAFGGESGSFNSTRSLERLAITTDSLTITPTSDFNGTIVISVKTIGLASPTLIINPTNNSTPLGIRATSTSNNTVIGYQAGQRLSNSGAGNDGATNTFIGANAGRNSTTVRGTLFIGVSAGESNVSGNDNLAIGNSALFSNKSGTENTAVGHSSLQNNTGSSNSAFGQSSLNINTSGGTNVAIGNQSLQNNTTGNNNSGLGVGVLQLNTTGSNNVAIGRNAGRYIAAFGNNTIVNNSIFIGYESRALADSQTNQVVIGYSTQGLGSNTTVLGNSSTITTAIYGNLLLGSTTDNSTDKLQVTGSTKLTGVLTLNSTISNGTYTYTLPSATGTLALTSQLSTYLPLAGGTLTGALGGTSATFSSSVTATSFNGTSQNIFEVGGSEKMRIVSGGNVLIGTTTDNGYKLYVSGTIYATGNITANSDLTLKKNLKLIDNPIDKLMRLNGYAYQWKSNDEHQYGVVAQEVEKILPYAVSTGNNGIKGVSYNQIIPVLIEAIKTQQTEINILKSKLA
jgi:hypothetical protein